MHVAKEFSAKAWAEKIIAMAEGRKAAENQVEEIHTVSPVVGNEMPIHEEFSAKAWTFMMLAKASRQPQA